MTLIIPPGFGNAQFIFTSDFGTAPFVTTMGVDLSAYAGDFVNAANGAFAAWTSTMRDQTDNALTLDRVTLSVGQDGPGGSVDSNLAPNVMNRNATGNAMSMAAIARKVTNELGRRGRGRMFLPGSVAQADVDDSGQLTSGRITNINGALASFLSALENGPVGYDPLPPFLLHSSAPTDPTPIESLAVQNLVGWIRGRIR